MLKPATILTAAAFCICGCTPAYRVHVNGYSELADPLDRDASIYVATEPNSPNPIFDRQIKTSLDALLGAYGYTPAETPEAADYRLGFQVAMESEKVVGHAPVYQSHFGSYGGYRSGFGFGYTTYAPYFDTLYDQWLILRLFASGPEGQMLVWVGEAMISTDRAELRETVDYLLVGCIEHLGVDTVRQVTMTIRKDDPRIVGLTDE